MPMKTILKFIIATVFLASSAAWSVEVQELRTGKFDFEYSIYGNGRSKPSQVFDDGNKTYLQYPANSSFPVFISPNGLIRYQYDIEGLYVIIKGLPRELIAQFGNSKTHIIHKSLTSTAVQYGNTYKSKPAPTTHGKNNLLPYTSDESRILNSWIDNSYAKPIKGDVIQWTFGSFEKEMVDRIYFEYGSIKLTSHSTKEISKIANEIGNAAEIIVVGSDDESYKEGLAQGRSLVLKNALIRNGIDASRITMKSFPPNESEQIKKGKSTQVASFIKWRPMLASASVDINDLTNRMKLREISSSRLDIKTDVSGVNQVESPKQLKFDILLTDKNLVATITRWGKLAGWTVVNQAAPEIKITGDIELKESEFIKAAEIAVAQSRDAGYKIKAIAYQNQTLVVTQDESK
jgi:outer membrane protein OmpA-like peptidoglycan-associated protein